MSAWVERLVVVGAAGVFVLGAGLGVNLAFSKTDTAPEEQEECQSKTVAKGDVLSSNLVMVNVYNTSTRDGLANRVKINLERRGFLGGMASNSPGKAKARNVTILTTTPDDPTVQLVALQFKGKVATAKPDFPTEKYGVSILVGQDYQGLKKAKTKIAATSDVGVCVPTITLP